MRRGVTSQKSLDSPRSRRARALVLLLATSNLVTAADASCPDGSSSCACEAGHVNPNPYTLKPEP